MSILETTSGAISTQTPHIEVQAWIDSISIINKFVVTGYQRISQTIIGENSYTHTDVIMIQ